MRNTNDGGMPPDAGTVLTNVTWIIDQLDGHGLSELDDLPILELAKHIAVGTRRAA
jgi:hypothetical protein